MRAAIAQNVNNIEMAPILRHTAPYHLVTAWKCGKSARTSLQNLYYEIISRMVKFPNFFTFLPFRYAGVKYSKVSSTTLANNFEKI